MRLEAHPSRVDAATLQPGLSPERSGKDLTVSRQAPGSRESATFLTNIVLMLLQRLKPQQLLPPIGHGSLL